MKYRIRFIGGPIGRWFRRHHWAGVTLPVPFWGVVVLLWEDGTEATLTAEQSIDRRREMRHEVLGHVPQVERMGSVRYLATILWQYAWCGHENAPMEIEARRLADEAHDNQERS